MAPRQIYCDESGFDGSNLWHPDQPHFVYAAVEIDIEEANSIVTEARSRFNLGGNEIHTGRMIRRNNGRSAIEWILYQIQGKYQLACFHKRYSLACKFFEYMIEPTISQGSSYFYHHGFHKFIATSLYAAAMTEPQTNEATLIEFQSLMRDRDSERMTNLIEGLSARAEGEKSFLQAIATVLICNQPVIRGELSMFDGDEDSRDESATKWLLELTVTALRSLCATSSGKSMLPLVVTCDDSKPLVDGVSYVNTMVGRTDFAQIEFDQREAQITFHLAEEVRFASSTDNCGIQLADVAASASAYALKRPEEDFSRQWREQHWDAVHEQSVFPDLDELDLTKERPAKNSLILQSLVDRSVRAIPLYTNLRDLDEMASQATNAFLSDMRSRMGSE